MAHLRSNQYLSIIVKKHYSCFCIIPLPEILIGNRIDALIFTGWTIDSCVHVAVIDGKDQVSTLSFPLKLETHVTRSSGYPLLDINLMCGDVVSFQGVTDYLERLGK